MFKKDYAIRKEPKHKNIFYSIENQHEAVLGFNHGKTTTPF